MSNLCKPLAHDSLYKSFTFQYLNLSARNLLLSLLYLAGRKIMFYNSTCRAYRNTFPAKCAFVKMNVCKIVFDGNGVECTFFNAFGAGYASNAAILFCYCSLFFIDARNKNAPVFFPFFAHFNYCPRTSFDACSTSHTFIIENYRESRGSIHLHGIEGTCSHTIAIS